MYRACFLFTGILCWFLCTAATASITDGPIWINELHYDNDGADQDEFVEVVAPVSFSALGDVSLTLYNGSSGAAYGGPTSLDEFTRGESVGGFVFYTLGVSMQNGAPDGLALSQGTSVLQFLSYEGSFMATDGVAAGLGSTDLVVSEATTTPVGWSLQLGGTGDSYADFAWQEAAPGTLGGLNLGQSFSTVPEPGSLALWLAALGIPAFWCRRLKRYFARG